MLILLKLRVVHYVGNGGRMSRDSRKLVGITQEESILGNDYKCNDSKGHDDGDSNRCLPGNRRHIEESDWTERTAENNKLESKKRSKLVQHLVAWKVYMYPPAPQAPMHATIYRSTLVQRRR